MTGKPTYISTAATTVVRTQPGVLQRIVITGGTAGTITVYDHASAATGNPIIEFSSTNTPDSLEFGATVNNGIVVVTSAATKLTVISSAQGEL